MQDEILGKALSADTSAIPRYRIADANGNIVAENATIQLINPVEQEGTPINTATLLTDETARQFKSSIPSTVNEALRLLAGGQGISYTGSIAASAWSGGTCSVTIPYDTGTRDLDALVIVAPVVTDSNLAIWKQFNVKAYRNYGTVLYFKADSNVTSTVQFTAIIFNL